MTPILVVVLGIVSACLIAVSIRYKKTIKANGNLETVSKKVNKSEKALAELNSSIEKAKIQRESAIELAEKDLELERERRIAEFNKNLQIEMAEIKAASNIEEVKGELAKVNKEIEEARQTLRIQQEQMLKAAEAEDFTEFHSIGLTPSDMKDIGLIREFAPQLKRQEAFFKLIWTEFYQKPIQALCKTLNAEKVTGIYKITNTENQRMYIGQAIDIAARWKEHCKCGLGIGSTGYMTNKFYKALYDKGIENFTFEILELCPKEKLNEREIYWIDFFNATAFGYNSKQGG